MRKTTVSSTLTVCFDGQFWVRIVEHVENGALSSCRVVFGAEPSNEEVLDFALREWARLPFGPAVACEERAMTGPKRRARQAARELKKRGPSTKAQVALAEQREALAQESAARDKEHKEEERRQRFEQRREKSKRKHQGH